MTRICAGLCAALLTVLAVEARAAPLEVYGRLPTIESIALSPDGASLASIVTDGELRSLAVQNLADGKLIAGLAAGDNKVRDIRWAGPNHVILTLSSTTQPFDVTAPRGEYAMAIDLNIRTHKAVQLLKNAAPGTSMMNIVVGRPDIRMIEGRPIAFVQGIHFVGRMGQQGLFRIDLEKGRTVLAEPGYANTREYVIAADGSAVAQAETSRSTGDWTLHLKDASGWRAASRLRAPPDAPSLLGLGRDSATVLMLQQEGDREQLREVSVKDGSIGEPLVGGDEARPIWRPDGLALAGVRTLVGDEERLRYFDPADQARWNAIVRAFPGDLVGFESASDDYNKVLVAVDSPTLGPAYAIVDLTTRKAAYVGERYRGLKLGDVSPVRSLAFKARDGLDLHGYLYVPYGRTAKDLPLVVLAHGGPSARDMPGFDWWAQALASRGYAVLQVNFRGSAGYGWPFLSAGFGEWGRKMQTDLSDGVRYLASEGIIDPKRVCIVGASYGGYAALAGPTLDRGIYRCAASIGGPSDLRRLVSWSRDRNGRVAERWWTRFMGAENAGDPILRLISPAEHADQADAPILLVHGRDDTVVPLSQSQTMADALRKADKPFEMVVLKGEDHWLTRGDTRLEMLKAVVAFLEKNNPPQ